MKRRLLHTTLSLIAMLWLGTFELIAQPGGPPGGGGGGGPVGGDAGVPLDGGILSLLLAGLGILAVRRLKRKKA